MDLAVITLPEQRSRFLERAPVMLNFMCQLDGTWGATLNSISVCVCEGVSRGDYQ